MNRKPIGLALGSGAVRGYALIPVIRRLEKEGIEIAAVSGSSIGALVGSYYALNGEVDSLFDRMTSLTKKDYLKLVDPNLPKISLVKGEKLKAFLMEEFFGQKTFAETKIPLFVCSVDTSQRAPVYLTKGRIIDAVMASIAIPGIFPPYEMDGSLWIDGGVLDPVPVMPLLDGGLERVVGIDLTGNLSEDDGNDLSLVPLLLDAFYMMMEQLARKGVDGNVFVLSPGFKPDPTNMLSFYDWEEPYEIGKELIDRKIGDLLDWLSD